MSYREHMRGYEDPRTLYQTEALLAWRRGEYFPPIGLEISPTHACNQHCRYCYTHGRVEQGQTLPEALLVKAFVEAAEAGVKSIMVQGTGEPLLHRGLPDAIQAGAERGLAITLTTNGVLLRPPLQERILPHLTFLKVSVLESDPAHYTHLHGCSEGQWHQLMENLRHAVALRKARHLDLALLGTVYLDRENFHRAADIIRTFKTLGLDYLVVQEATYTEYSPSGPEPYGSSYFKPEEIAAMKAEVLALQDEDFRVKVRYPVDDEDLNIGMNAQRWRNGRCQGMCFHALVASDGAVYPCWRAWGDPALSHGNLRDASFETIWRGARRRQVEAHLNGTPPEGDACSVCNIIKLNEILARYSEPSRWKDFLV